MKIKKIICAPGKTGFYFDDQKAIKGGAKNDGAFYIGDEDETCVSQDMFVNAWMPLPKNYKESEE